MRIFKLLLPITFIIALIIGCNSTTFQSDEHLIKTDTDSIIMSHIHKCTYFDGPNVFVSDIGACLELQEITKEELSNISYEVKFAAADALYGVYSGFFNVTDTSASKSLINLITNLNQRVIMANNLDSKPHKALNSIEINDCFNAQLNYNLFLKEQHENLQSYNSRYLNKNEFAKRLAWYKKYIKQFLEDEKFCGKKN